MLTDCPRLRDSHQQRIKIMQTLIKTTLLFLVVSLSSHVTWADEFDAAITAFENAGASGAYFDSAYGYAVFPTIGKGGIGIGGAHGSGRVYAQTPAQ